MVRKISIRGWDQGIRDFDLESEPRGRPEPVIDNNELRTLVESDPRQSLRDIAEKLGVHYSTVSRHFPVSRPIPVSRNQLHYTPKSAISCATT